MEYPPPKKYNWVSIMYSHGELVSKLTDAEQLQFFKAFLAYGLHGIEPTFDHDSDRAVEFIWLMVKETIDKMRARLGRKLVRMPIQRYGKRTPSESQEAQE